MTEKRDLIPESLNTEAEEKPVEKKKIIVIVEGGLISDISGIPKDIIVETHDYDTDGSEPEREETDADGNNYLKNQWES